MKRLIFSVAISLFAGQIALNALAVDAQKVAQDNFVKIKQLKQSNQKLLGDIEQLQQQQKLNQQKIAELFHLLEYKTENSAKKAVILKVKNEDMAAKKAYSNARSFLLTEQYDQAIDLFLRYLKRYPNNTQVADVYYWLGKTYVAKGNHENAKKVFIDFQKKYPLHLKFANSLYELALVQQALKANEAAVKLLQTMLKKFPNHLLNTKAKTLLTAIKSNKTKAEAKPNSGQTKTSNVAK